MFLLRIFKIWRKLEIDKKNLLFIYKDKLQKRKLNKDGIKYNR